MDFDVSLNNGNNAWMEQCIIQVQCLWLCGSWALGAAVPAAVPVIRCIRRCIQFRITSFKGRRFASNYGHRCWDDKELRLGKLLRAMFLTENTNNRPIPNNNPPQDYRAVNIFENVCDLPHKRIGMIAWLVRKLQLLV